MSSGSALTIEVEETELLAAARKLRSSGSGASSLSLLHAPEAEERGETPMGILTTSAGSSDTLGSGTSIPRGISPAGNATSDSTSIDSAVPPNMPTAAKDVERQRSGSIEYSSPQRPVLGRLKV